MSSPSNEDDAMSAKVWLKTTTPSKMIHLATTMFRSVSANRIQECNICLDLISSRLDASHSELIKQEALWPQLNCLMLTITTFKNLSTFKFLTTEVAHISESFLARIISQLFNLNTIVLCGYNIGHVTEKLGHTSDLGTALVSRLSLKNLDIRYLKSFNTDWINLEWRCHLHELTIEPIILSTNSLFPERNLLEFCHIFHQSLIVLNLATSEFNYQQETVTLAQDFNHLRHLTFHGSHRFINVFSMCPRLESLTWLNGSPRLTEEVKGIWASLKIIRIPRDYFEEHDMKRDSSFPISRFEVKIIHCTLSLGIKDAWTDLNSWFNYKPPLAVV
ncbi:uncharacterized protein MELLADRAFT_102052 [Melampsora larici-populina 98AG31]|uniref:F-box domain-containing protein n=1 Tax=Melampsora larici-populina (strain 98AG31 / pathotype 3-4-7) TaxID=747676 RepID=F4R5U7_MELLP|nr:uncharacterized protein MELLADRAFT_102052 [Melampsora larici-populina 98AG31]EGG12191.1 hypothetical protein MELLADRAFT_102052 [Melampsora larici-populina 98AG31]